MDSSWQNDALFLFVLNRRVSHSEKWDFQSSKRLSENFFLQVIVDGMVLLHQLSIEKPEVSYHLHIVGICERRRISELNLLPVRIELELEGKTIECDLLFSKIIIQKFVMQLFPFEFYIVAALDPSLLPVLINLTQITRVNIRLHSPWIHCFAFLKIYYVELYLFFPTILYAKVKPLRMTPCVRVSPHEQVVLIFIYLNANIQVSTFEVTVKNKFLVFRNGRIHAFKDASGLWLKIWVKFTKICCHMQIIGVDDTLI